MGNLKLKVKSKWQKERNGLKRKKKNGDRDRDRRRREGTVRKKQRNDLFLFFVMRIECSQRKGIKNRNEFGGRER